MKLFNFGSAFTCIGFPRDVEVTALNFFENNEELPEGLIKVIGHLNLIRDIAFVFLSEAVDGILVLSFPTNH